ncbi:MAG: AAA family ATPase [Spirochaetales bacterium]|nr:AAA family ATPase [Spirochaetales bacterium]
MRILPIASGKGGVGKSLLASNISLALGQAGQRVILIDLDLGASNIHQVLGLARANKGIGTFLADKNAELESVIMDTEYENLRVIPGDTEIPGLANIQTPQKNRLLRGIRKLDADFVVLDLGAGSSFNTIDFFLASHQGVVVTSPTLTSTLNAYLFLKNVIFRIITTSFTKKSPASLHLEALKSDGASLQRLYIPKLLEKLKKADPKGYENFEKKLETFKPLLALNLLDNPKDVEKGEKIQRSCKEYLGIDMEHLGVIYRDSMQDIALRSRLPIIRYKPMAVISQAIYRMADKLIQKSDIDDSGLDITSTEESFQTAELEAEVDFAGRLEEIQNLLRTGALSQGDLLETIKTQHYEIDGLRKENFLLKSKLLKASQEGFSI